MRSIILGLLAGSVAVVSATKDGCTQGHLKELLFASSCSDFESISTCLGGADLERLEELELCFYAGGCEAKYATAGARWFASECHIYKEDEEVVAELRRRADETTTESTSKASSTTKATSSTTIASTEATTTSDSSTTSASTATSSTLSTTTSSTSTSSTASSTTTGSSSSTLVCSTTSMITTTACSYYTTGSSSGKSTCSSTEITTSTCASGIICSTDSAGSATCMKRDDHLTTSGLIVTICFSVGIGAFFITLITLYAKSNSKDKKQKAEREALLGNPKMMGEHDLEAVGTYAPIRKNSRMGMGTTQQGGDGNEANLPLIRTESGRQPQYDYFEGDTGAGAGAAAAASSSSSSSPGEQEHPAASNVPPTLH